MKRIIATIALALPLATLCVLPKSASAETVRITTSNHHPRTVVAQRHRKVWVKGHYVTVRHHRQWVAGHYEYR
jgi:hypothetical protein